MLRIRPSCITYRDTTLAGAGKRTGAVDLGLERIVGRKISDGAAEGEGRTGIKGN